MRKLLFTGLVSLLAVLSLTAQEKTFVYNGNPIVRDIYTADPSAHVWTVDGKERLYVYPSHDIAPPRGCDFMDKYHVYSTEDMVNWIDHGQILERTDVPWAEELADNGKFMWAPDCVYRNGKYYFYFPTPVKDPWGDTWQIGIAVSDKPASDFVVLNEPLKGIPSHGQIDPCVFIDDDGQAYFYYGGGGTCYGAKLKDNMIELDGSLQQFTGLSDFHEGTWVFKKAGNYYLCYADGNGGNGNQLRYAMSSSPLGPWQYRGVYLRPTGCDTSHGSVLEYKGEWWAFYHNKVLSNQGALRSICMDRLYFNENNRILEVKQTKDVGSPYGGTPWAVPGTIEAEDFNEGLVRLAYEDRTPLNAFGEYRPDEPVDINKRGNTYFITNTGSGEYIHYTFDVAEDGLYDVDFIVGNTLRNSTGQFYLEFDQKTSLNPTKYDVEYTGATKMTTVTAPSIELTKGKHSVGWFPLSDLNFDKFTFRLLGTGISNAASRLVSVYSDPITSSFRIQASQTGIISIVDVNGKMIRKEKMTTTDYTIDMTGQAPGIYILSLQMNDRVYQQKLIKQ
jgi:hypothetical protein